MARNNQAQDRMNPPGATASRDFQEYKFNDLPIGSLFWLTDTNDPQNTAYRKINDGEGLHTKLQSVESFVSNRTVFERI